MKNQVIKVLNREHGKKVIEYWKNRGVYTGGSLGIITEEDGKEFIYYGVIDGMFSNYGYQEVLEHNAEIIELPGEFKRGERVLVRDRDDSEWYESIFITKIDGAVYPYVVVSSNYEDEFINGKGFYTTQYTQCKKLPTQKEITMQEIADKFGIDVNNLKIKK
jgi:hypothetical protein